MNFFEIAFILHFLNLSYVSRFWKNLQSDNLELYQRATLSEFPIFLAWNCKMDIISIYQKDTYTGLNANCTSFVPWNHHTIWISSLVTGYNPKHVPPGWDVFWSAWYLQSNVDVINKELNHCMNKSGVLYYMVCNLIGRFEFNRLSSSTKYCYSSFWNFLVPSVEIRNRPSRDNSPSWFC